MAILTASWTFADGDQCDVSVEIENDYPDALSQAVVTCVDLIRSVLVTGIAVQQHDEDDE